MLRSPVRWIGGKGKMVQKILPWFPRHRCYVEAFGGGASLLLNKRRSEVEVYNDLNENLVRLFEAAQCHGQRLFTTVALTPYSRREQAHARDRLEQPEHMLVAHRQSFGGKISGYGLAKTHNNEMALTTSSYWQAVRQLPELSRRLRNVTLRSQDALELLAEFDAEDTLFYLDPPYVPDTWTNASGIYEGHTMELEAHQLLVERLLAVKGMVVLSGYPNDCYAPLTEAWTVKHFAVSCSLAARTDSHGLKGAGKVKELQPRTECLWINPQAMRRLGR